MARIEYQQEAVVEENDLSLTVLEISRKHHIPHISACGGKARCSTCRILVLEGEDNLLARNAAEQRLATLKGFEQDIRLACQTRLSGPITLRRLVLDDQDAELADLGNSVTSGREEVLAVLFSDIRRFTPFAESHLPYDVVHILNRYFHHMGEAVLARGGVIDKYIGDGMMALFGLDKDDPASACRHAVRCGLDMLASLGELNRYLARYFATTLEIGIGIHVGGSDRRRDRPSEPDAIHSHRRYGQRRQPHRIGDEGFRSQAGGVGGGAATRRRYGPLRQGSEHFVEGKERADAVT